MKMLVHYTSDVGQALGVWWESPEGEVLSYYFQPNSLQESRANAIMNSRAKGFPVEDFFQSLTERAPYFENWALFDSYQSTPEEVLTLAQKALEEAAA